MCVRATWVCTCVYLCVRGYACACVCASSCACVRAYFVVSYVENKQINKNHDYSLWDVHVPEIKEI